MAFVRCRKCRGGTPTGERAALSARPHPEGCGRKATRLSASRRPVLFEHDPEKWHPVFRKDHASLKAERDLEAAAIHRRRLMTGSGFASCASYRQNSGAQASRERFPTASLPGLTRQSMLGAGSLRFAASFALLHVSMDHRVKPGGDDRVGRRTKTRWRHRGAITTQQTS